MSTQTSIPLRHALVVVTGASTGIAERVTSGMTAEQHGCYDALHASRHRTGPDVHARRQKGCPPREVGRARRRRSSASGLALATPSAATLRSSFASLGTSPTACWTACSPALLNATSPKPCRRRERTTRASVSARSDGECEHVVREVAERTRQALAKPSSVSSKTKGRWHQNTFAVHGRYQTGNKINNNMNLNHQYGQ